MMALDYSMAKLAHQQWKFRVRSYLDGLKPMTQSELVSHHDCEFGKWLYSKGMDEMGHLPEMKQLEQSHAAMHTTIREVLEAKQAGDDAKAEQKYQQVVELSDEVVHLIDHFMEAPAA